MNARELWDRWHPGPCDLGHTSSSRTGGTATAHTIMLLQATAAGTLHVAHNILKGLLGRDILVSAVLLYKDNLLNISPPSGIRIIFTILNELSALFFSPVATVNVY